MLRGPSVVRIGGGFVKGASWLKRGSALVHMCTQSAQPNPRPSKGLQLPCLFEALHSVPLPR